MKTTLLFLFIFPFSFAAVAQQGSDKLVASMIDLNDIQMKVTTKYNKVDADAPEITLEEGYDSEYDPECARKGFNYATIHIEQTRIQSAIKQSIKTTMSVFGSTLGTLGFKYVVEGVEILSMLDDIQEAGGDAEDFTKAVAEYAYKKGSGKLVDKVKQQYPDLFGDAEPSGEVLEKLMDEAKSQTESFFHKLLNPPKVMLFEKESTTNGCYEYYTGEITSNEEELVPDHTGPVLVLKVGVWCHKCPKDKIRPIKEVLLRYNVPLVLTKNPDAVPMENSTKRKILALLGKLPPDYIYVPDMNAVTIKLAVNCCDGSEEEDEVAYLSPDQGNTYAISTTGLVFDFDGEYSGFEANPSLGVLHDMNATSSAGALLRYRVGQFGTGDYKNTAAGWGGELFYQHQLPAPAFAPALRPYARLSIPAQNVKLSETSGGSSTDYARQWQAAVNGQLGLRFDYDRWGFTAGYNVLSISMVKQKNLLLGGDYGDWGRSTVIGFNSNACEFGVFFTL